MIKIFYSYTAKEGVTVLVENECHGGSQVHWTQMFICSMSQSRTVKITHTNMGATKYHYKIHDKCYFLPWCKLQAHGHFLIEISLHHMAFGENTGAGSAPTPPPPGRVAGLWQVTKWLDKSSGMQVLVGSTTGRGFAEMSVRPETVKNYPILESNCTEVLNNRLTIYSSTIWKTKLSDNLIN